MPRPIRPFQFKQFLVHQDQCAMKIGTDGVLLGAWADTVSAKTILDIGTGTGVIALMQAQRNADANVQAIEIDAAASNQAKQNFELSRWSERLAVENISLQKFATTTKQQFDVILSNPPFYPAEHFSAATGKKRQMARSTIALSFEDLIYHSKKLLAPKGQLSIILPIEAFEEIQQLLAKQQLHLQRITYVRPKKDKAIHRVLFSVGFQSTTIEENELIIQKEQRNDFTEAYIELVKGFYTIL